jgi:cell division protein FtsX
MISNILILGVNYGSAGSKYGKPYDSTVGIPGIVGLIILIAFTLFVVYVAIRIWLINRKENK